ncbi:MAG: hypothetical protein U9R34_06125 [Nanoarchaeota archaeon]|nr:hypothetical protein [Nanoarchaeota archaeon]
MPKEDLIFKYKKYLEKAFLDEKLIKIGECSNSDNSWYNVKALQFMSGMAQFGIDEKNVDILKFTKELFFFAISKQHDDGYYFSEKYSGDHQKMRTNVIFINIELFNTFELLEDTLTEEEKEVFFASVNKSTKYIKSYLRPTSELNQNIAGLLYFLFCKKYNLHGMEEVDFQKRLIQNLQTESGYWGEKKEALGFDALYGTLSLAYLARACDLDESLKENLIKGVSFVSHFIKDGEVDLSFSKRWIPKTPQGHRFFVYGLTKGGV